MTLPVKDPSESVVVEFDFSDEMSVVSTVIVSLQVYGAAPGADPLAATILEGTPQILPPNKVLQRIGKGVSGVDYKLRAVGINGLDRIVRADVLKVRTF